MTTSRDPKHSPLCPDCGSCGVLHIGRIPPANGFAGRIFPHLLDGGHLWRCPGCHLAFRWPTLDKAELDALYAAGAEYAWNGSPDVREDWRIARRWLREVLPRGSTVLDVGCFDGGFLDFLGDSYRRCGIEIHAAARQRAEARGITVVGTDFESVSYVPEPVDCVTAFDVVEHVHHPARFLKQCRDLVKPHGWIVISTGNADAPSFRFMGAGYWYCAIAEHLSFISPRWCHAIAQDLGLSFEKHAIFSHGRRDWPHCLQELSKNMLYHMAPRLFAWLRSRGIGGIDASVHAELAVYPPCWMSAKDHFIALLRRR